MRPPAKTGEARRESSAPQQATIHFFLTMLTRSSLGGALSPDKNEKERGAPKKTTPGQETDYEIYNYESGQSRTIAFSRAGTGARRLGRKRGWSLV